MSGKVTINRLEVIHTGSETTGRVFHWYEPSGEDFVASYDLQDDGKTLKVFLTPVNEIEE